MFLWLPCNVCVRPPLPLDQILPFILHLLVSKDLLHSIFLIIIDRTQLVVQVVCTLLWFEECDIVYRMYVVPYGGELQSIYLLFHCVGDLKQSDLLIIQFLAWSSCAEVFGAEHDSFPNLEGAVQVVLVVVVFHRILSTLQLPFEDFPYCMEVFKSFIYIKICSMLQIIHINLEAWIKAFECNYRGKFSSTMLCGVVYQLHYCQPTGPVVLVPVGICTQVIF